jgi:glycosyltransferase involved in cell wall biosynthesis
MSSRVKSPAGELESFGENGQHSRVLVGIPAYNEEVGIGSVVLSCHDYADEVVVADDGSSDRTVQLARRAGADVIQHETNRGKGGAVKTLFAEAESREFDAFVLLDGDGQHLPSDIPDVTGPVLDSDVDLVIGSRYLDSGADDETPLYRRVGQKVLDTLTSTSTGTKNLTDTQSGFRAFSPRAVEDITLQTNGIGVESEMIGSAAEADLDIAEKPIDVRYEGVDGQTFNPVSHGMSVVLFVLQLVRDRHPLVFFGLPGLVLMIAGALYGIEGILVYQQSGQFYPAKVLVSGFVTILGTLGVFCGLILNSVSNMINRLEVGRT